MECCINSFLINLVYNKLLNRYTLNCQSLSKKCRPALWLKVKIVTCSKN